MLAVVGTIFAALVINAEAISMDSATSVHCMDFYESNYVMAPWNERDIDFLSNSRLRTLIIGDGRCEITYEAAKFLIWPRQPRIALQLFPVKPIRF